MFSNSAHLILGTTPSARGGRTPKARGGGFREAPDLTIYGHRAHGTNRKWGEPPPSQPGGRASGVMADTPRNPGLGPRALTDPAPPTLLTPASAGTPRTRSRPTPPPPRHVTNEATEARTPKEAELSSDLLGE